MRAYTRLFAIMTVGVVPYCATQIEHASALECAQADIQDTRAAFEDGDYARGDNPAHVRLKAGVPKITVQPDHTCTVTIPTFEWSSNRPMGNLIAELAIIYLDCGALAHPPPWHPVPRDKPGACPFLQIRDYVGA